VYKCLNKLVYCASCFACECESCLFESLSRGVRSYQCAAGTCIDVKWWYDGKTNHIEVFKELWSFILRTLREVYTLPNTDPRRKVLIAQLTEDMVETQMTFKSDLRELREYTHMALQWIMEYTGMLLDDSHKLFDNDGQMAELPITKRKKLSPIRKSEGVPK